MIFWNYQPELWLQWLQPGSHYWYFLGLFRIKVPHIKSPCILSYWVHLKSRFDFSKFDFSEFKSNNWLYLAAAFLVASIPAQLQMISQFNHGAVHSHVTAGVCLASLPPWVNELLQKSHDLRNDAGGLQHDLYFSIQLGMSSSHLTNSNLFQRGRVETQPPTRMYPSTLLDRGDGFQRGNTQVQPARIAIDPRVQTHVLALAKWLSPLLMKYVCIYDK